MTSVQKAVLNISTIITLFFFALSAMAQEKETDMEWYGIVGGASYHNTGSKPNLFNQQNPTLGLGIKFKEDFLGGKQFME